MSSNEFRKQDAIRHALHLRPHYELALAVALKHGTRTTVAELDSLAAVASLYSATTEGLLRVPLDLEAAEKRQLWEVGAVLRASHNSGISLREAAEATAALLKPTQKGPQVLGERPLREWLFDKPFWPKRETMLASFAATDLTPNAEQLAVRAYRILFAHAWRNCFTQVGNPNPVGPFNDDEGFQWRRYATEVAAREIGGAVVIRPPQMGKGMCVYNGFGIRTVAAVLGKDNQKVARAGGKVIDAQMFQIGYADGNMDKMVAGDTEFIRLPAIEKGLISGPPTLRTPIKFS